MRINAATRLLAYEVKQITDDHALNSIRKANQLVRDYKKHTIDLGSGYSAELAQTPNKTAMGVVINYEDKLVGGMTLYPAVHDQFLNPHATLLQSHRGKGIIPQLYSWILDSGTPLITRKHHSPEANKVWDKLSTKYRSFLVRPRMVMTKQPAVVIPYTSDHSKEGFERLLLPKQWTIPQLKKALNK